MKGYDIKENLLALILTVEYQLHPDDALGFSKGNNTDTYQKLYNQGYTDREIAEICGVTKKSISLWRNSRGLESNYVLQLRERDRKIKSLLEQGYSLHEIGKEINLTENRVYQLAKREGLI